MAGEEATSPSRWMMMTTRAIAKGRSRGGTDHSTSAFEGACARTRAAGCVNQSCCEHMQQLLESAKAVDGRSCTKRGSRRPSLAQ